MKATVKKEVKNVYHLRFYDNKGINENLLVSRFDNIRKLTTVKTETIEIFRQDIKLSENYVITEVNVTLHMYDTMQIYNESDFDNMINVVKGSFDFTVFVAKENF